MGLTIIAFFQFTQIIASIIVSSDLRHFEISFFFFAFAFLISKREYFIPTEF